ncbi:MAG: hypothetical protein F6K42_39380 [Leptolyngbya sp. SIO1D8]|nr:hypothetical protein [Leptolyngbya sp. SIO1D8]
MIGGKPKAGSGPWLKYQYCTIAFVGIVFNGLSWVVGFVAGLLGAVFANFVA